MKDLTFFPLHSFAMKKAGIVFSALGIILLIAFNYFITDLNEVIPGSSPEVYSFLIFVIGLFSIVFSKERFEDERTEKIRGRSMQIGFALSSVLGISLFIVHLITGSLKQLSITDYLFITSIILSVYIVYFHISLFFDLKGNYSNNSVGENILKNKRFFIFYIIALILIGLAITVF